MRARIVLRTHYQADEPRAIIAVVTDCSSLTQSRHEDAVAAALVKWAKGNHYTLSLPGAVYAVGNARSLGLLNNSHRWTPTGLAFGYIHAKTGSAIGSATLILATPEERLYLKCFLENGGALLIKFGQWLIERGGTTDDELRAASVIERLLVEALDEYLTIVSDIRDRTTIRRERDRLSRSDYASATKRHKRYPLLKTMERLRLIVTQEVAEQRTSISPDSAGRLAALLKAVPDVTTLERYCRDDVLDTIIDTTLYDSGRAGGTARINTATLMADAYRFAIDRGLQACPLSYLDDLLFAYSLAGEPNARGNAEQVFEPLHHQYPTDVRFHVDRRGRRAFLLISGEPFKILEASLTSVLS